MSDANDNENGRNAGGRAPLTLKPRAGGSVSAGTVRQSFSHGRSKTVVVETKRRAPRPEGVRPVLSAPPRPATPVAPEAPAAPRAPQPAPPPAAAPSAAAALNL